MEIASLNLGKEEYCYASLNELCIFNDLYLQIKHINTEIRKSKQITNLIERRLELGFLAARDWKDSRKKEIKVGSELSLNSLDKHCGLRL